MYRYISTVKCANLTISLCKKQGNVGDHEPIFVRFSVHPTCNMSPVWMGALYIYLSYISPD